MIPDEIKRAFKMAACRLHREKRDQMLFKTEECSGVIKTDWETRSVATRSGVLFKAEVESEDGSWQVNFLLHTRDLERGAERLHDEDVFKDGVWLTTPVEFPVEELYQFEDLSTRRLN